MPFREEIMESYIVRIIRRENDNPERIVGTLEEVETEKRVGFNSFDKLKDILSQRSNRGTKKMVVNRGDGKG